MNMCKLYATMHDVTASLQAFDGLGEDFMVFSMLSGWWFGTFFTFPYIAIFIIPIDFHIFQRDGSTTNQLWCFSGHDCSCRASYRLARSRSRGRAEQQ